MATILHAIETGGPGGAENTLLNLVDSLAEIGHQSVVCLLKEGWLSAQVRDRGVECWINPLQGKVDATWLINLRRQIGPRGIDVIHTHEFEMNIRGGLLALTFKKPVVGTVHGRHHYPERWVRRFAYRCVAMGRIQLVAVSENIRDTLTSVVGIPGQRITVIPNGIDVSRYEPDAAARVAARTALGISDDELLLGAIGNLYEIKGHTYLIDAFAQLARQHPRIRLVIAGRGKQEAALRAQIGQLGLGGEQVRLLGFRDDVPQLLQAFDVFVLPSLSEGTPLAVIEAMASATPIVATDVGGVGVLLAGEAGTLCSPASAQALAEALHPLIVDAESRFQMGTAGHQRARERHSVQRMRDSYLPLYGVESPGRLG